MLSFETYEVPVESVRWRGNDVDLKRSFVFEDEVCLHTDFLYDWDPMI